MARPRKQGLDYFPLDVDFFNDEKIVAISGEFGLKGEITALKLLCAIYRNGYFIEWSEMLRAKLLRSLVGVSPELLDQIVSRLVKWGFFDKSLFDSASILTSKGIQKRYLEATKRWANSSIDTRYFIAAQGVKSQQTPVAHVEPRKEPHAAPPSSPTVMSLDQEINQLRADLPWIESLAAHYSLPKEEILDALGDFALSCSKDGHPSLQDCKSHFYRWLAKPRKPKPAPKPDRNPGKSSDLEAKERNEKYDLWNRTKVNPRKYIRSKGYDPDKVTMAMLGNPQWCAENPPTLPPVDYNSL